VSGNEITPKEALIRLGTSTAEAIEEVLSNWSPGSVKRGEVTVPKDGESPFAGLAPGVIASSVSYVDGATGANIFVMTPAGARKLAEAMGVPPAEDAETEITELELSAVAEVANQTMAAAAAAIGAVLGHEIEISPPDTQVLENPSAAADIYGKTPHATSTTFLLGGESCRLIQLVPSAFVVRMAKAMDELSTVSDQSRGDASQATSALLAALGHTKLRVWAELGRTRMPLGRALSLPLGAVVDLDEAADAPVKLFVNGVAFARGHLVVQGGEWALRIDELLSGGSLAAAMTGAAQTQASAPKAESPDPKQLEGALS
jgi:flagellar motor switch protein FliN/FliY